MEEHILVVDDNPEIRRLLADSLQRKGFRVSVAADGRQGLQTAYAEHPSLVILDLMMPEMDGWQVCQRLREMSQVPIIVLSACTTEDDVVHGLALGADDYVRKPFMLRELEGRIRTVLRRVRAHEHENPGIFDDGVLRIDLDRQETWRHGQPIHLTPTEYKLLSNLVRRRGVVVSHKELLTAVWGVGYEDATTNLSLYIRYIREKLEENPGQPKYIRTKWGVGYMFAPNGATAA